MKRQIFISKEQLQIENSGFVKTCDEHVRRHEYLPFFGSFSFYRHQSQSLISHDLVLE